MTTLISAEQHWTLWAILFGAAAFGLWAERTRLGSRVSGAVLTILVTFVLSNARVIPVSAPAYDVVWDYFLPLAIPLLLFRADLRRIVREAGPTLFAFAAAAVGTVIGTLIAFRIVPLGEEGWKLAGIFCATYVGGSMNFGAVANSLELQSGDLLAASIAADNLMMTLYFLVLFALPSLGFLRRAFVRRDEIENAPEAGSGDGHAWRIRDLSLMGICFALALAAGLCAAGYGLASVLGYPSAGILVVTALTVTLATLAPRRLEAVSGAENIGTLFMQIFFAVIGATANIAAVLRSGTVLLLFAGIILSVHLITILGLGKLMRLDLREIIIASNANMGGPTTAAAMAASRGWNSLVLPAILCGTLGYAIATFVGDSLARHVLR
ncbi:MAG: DUF819 family protein [bacterium]|nr:DUF819 family protein [bacterium]